MNNIGLYIHIPFCAAKCPYCDFYSLTGTQGQMDAYTAAVIRAMEQHPYPGVVADTLYFGGGTPALLEEKRLSAILEAAARYFRLDASGEITLEANPGVLQPDALASLHKSGFNRISFGVQSLQERELEALGRRHSAKQAIEAIASAHKAGFRHLSADLILGTPYQDMASLENTVKQLAALPVDHVSAYMLKVEEGTGYHQNPILEHCPDEDLTADLYLLAVELLGNAGLRQYEISNFARCGGKSLHNLKYWRAEPYLGIGPAAHSCMEGKRFYFPRDLDAFLRSENPFALVRQDGDGGGLEEFAMLRLRLAEGLDLQELRHRFGADPAPYLDRAKPLERHGLVATRNCIISLTPYGFLLSNAVTAEILYGN